MEDFSDFLHREQASINEAEEAATTELAATQHQETLAWRKKEEALRHRRELATALQSDASEVAAAARDQVAEDAIIGRIVPRTLGWIVSIQSLGHNNGQSDYAWRSWNMVHATVLSPNGRLQTAEPVLVKKRDWPLTSRPELSRVLRRSAGLTEVGDVDGSGFNVFRTQLARFVLDNNLQV